MVCSRSLDFLPYILQSLHCRHTSGIYGSLREQTSFVHHGKKCRVLALEATVRNPHSSVIGIRSVRLAELRSAPTGARAAHTSGMSRVQDGSNLERPRKFLHLMTWVKDRSVTESAASSSLIGSDSPK